MSISNAVGSEVISRVIGWKTVKGNFATSGTNLPQRIAILAEANTANQASIGSPVIPFQITSAKQAGDEYGYGSPIHMIARILFPPNGGGVVGSIPTFVYPNAEPSGAAAKIQTITVTGTATANGTHYVKICGRRGLEGQTYAVNIETGDTNSDIAAKIEDAINAVLGCPVTATAPDDSEPNPNVVTCTSKWNGLTANDIVIEVDTNDVSLGISYAVASTQSGAGTPSLADALAAFGNTWNTIVINGYGLQSDVVSALEAFNGVPADGASAPTGRYAATLMKPFVALTGSTADDPSATTDADARKTQVTIAVCPAPASDGLHFEAAANYAALAARQAQDSPHLDIAGQYLPDMPVPADEQIGTMASFANRDIIVKKGCSTVDMINGLYQVQDFVTTYHPAGEVPPQYRYVRNLQIDWNVRYTYYLLELVNVADHMLANDNDVVNVARVVKPKIWKGILYNMYADLSGRGMIVDAPFSEASTLVGISNTNPDRFETFFRYKRSGFGRVLSTTAEAGFNFGQA